LETENEAQSAALIASNFLSKPQDQWLKLATVVETDLSPGKLHRRIQAGIATGKVWLRLQEMHGEV
jgi:hypothetical protein